MILFYIMQYDRRRALWCVCQTLIGNRFHYSKIPHLTVNRLSDYFRNSICTLISKKRNNKDTIQYKEKLKTVVFPKRKYTLSFIFMPMSQVACGEASLVVQHVPLFSSITNFVVSLLRLSLYNFDPCHIIYIA